MKQKMRVNFINVETTALQTNEVKNWNNHEFKTIIGFKEERYFYHFLELIEIFSKANLILKPDTIGLGYALRYHMYNNQNVINMEKDFGDFWNKKIEDTIKEYQDKKYFFIMFTLQKFCYDPMQAVVNSLYEFMNSYEHSCQIDEDNIKWICNLKV